MSNFTLTFPALGFIAAFVSLARSGDVRRREAVAEVLFAYFLLFSIGISFFYNFVMHVVFGEMSARFIGWEDSPFQAEVGFASLGFAAIGFLAFHGGPEMRLAADLGPAFFLWGAAAGHIVPMVSAQNFAPGSAGAIFYTDVLLPILGLVLIRPRHGTLVPSRSA